MKNLLVSSRNALKMIRLDNQFDKKNKIIKSELNKLRMSITIFRIK